MLDARRTNAGLTPPRIAGWRRIVLLATILVAPLVVIAAPDPSGAQPCEPWPDCQSSSTTEEDPTPPTTPPTTATPTTRPTPTTAAPPPPEVTQPPTEDTAPPPEPEEEDEPEVDDESAAVEEVEAPAEPANLTFTTINDLLVQGNGLQGAQATTTSTTAATGSGNGSADDDSRLMWMIIAALAGVGLLVALLTWRYWLLTRPGLAFDDDEEQDAGGPGGFAPQRGGGRTAVPDPYTSAMPTSPAARRARSGDAPRSRRRRDEGDPFWDDPGGGPRTTALGVGGLPRSGGARGGSGPRGGPAGVPPAPARGGRRRPPGPDTGPPGRRGAGDGRRRSGRGGDPRGGPPPADGRGGRPGSGSGRRARDDGRGGGGAFPGPGGSTDDMWGPPGRR
jgi:hypothetical protein